MVMLSYFQAIIMGLLQGVSELFPVSSLGHSVLFPSLFGWHNLVAAQVQPTSFFLTFLVGLHVATALALLVFYWKEWRLIIAGFFGSLRTRQITDNNARLAWLLIIATIPAGVLGLLFEKKFRIAFAKPLAAAIFLIINGFILLLGEYLAKHPATSQRLASRSRQLTATNTASQLQRLTYRNAFLIGAFQVLALLAGISRSGITMVGGLWQGLERQDAARFSFLLATPVILLAGLYKLPSLAGSSGNGVRGQILIGSLFAAISAYLAVRYLDRYFKNHSLKPFAYYCFVFGGLMVIKLH